jgi:hypothetical protein
MLICGDSFAADWTVKYQGQGWPNLLANEYAVTNLAQAGCGQYKIYLQLKSVDVSDFDIILVCHTSPYRIYVKHHPTHANDILHCHSDLIYSDISEHVKKNKSLIPIMKYYEEYFDTDCAKFVHELIVEKITQHLSSHTGKVLQITFFESESTHYSSQNLNFHDIFKRYPGLMNHLDLQGNSLIFEKITALLSDNATNQGN